MCVKSENLQICICSYCRTWKPLETKHAICKCLLKTTAKVFVGEGGRILHPLFSLKSTMTENDRSNLLFLNAFRSTFLCGTWEWWDELSASQRAYLFFFLLAPHTHTLFVYKVYLLNLIGSLNLKWELLVPKI